MGKDLFSTLFATLFLMTIVEAFAGWYRKFLVRRRLPLYLRRLIVQIMWVLLALLLWNMLYRNFMPAEFDLSHLLFALFIYALRGLVVSILRKN